MTRVFGYSAYSLEYGTFLGIGWGIMFLLYIYSIITLNPLLFLAFFFLMIVCFFLPFYFAFRIRKKYSEIEERLSYVQGLTFSMGMFMYACLVSGVVAFAYFEFIDNGNLCQTLIDTFNNADLQTTYQKLGMEEPYKEMMQLLDEASSLSSFEKAMAVFNNNFIFSLILSFFVAFGASFAPLKRTE